jgi:SWI/SNF-related matrix-associated actin-dependent regulator 1 of chromatin subfamily A
VKVLSTPYTFQTEDAHKAAVEFGGRALLGHEMGLGKTLISLLTTTKLTNALPAVVVAPASIKWGWRDEIVKHLGAGCQVLAGTKPKRNDLDLRSDVYVVSYNILHAWMPYLIGDVRPSTLILDECHAVKDAGTRQSKAARYLALHADYVLPISGTPLLNRPAELFPVLNMTRPDLYPSYLFFAQQYCAPRMTPWGTWEARGAENLDELHADLDFNLLVRRRKCDVLDQLPAKTRSVVPLEIANPGEYHKAEKDFLAWLRKNHGAARAHRASFAQRLVQVGYLKRLAARLKWRAVADWVRTFLLATDGKLLLFAVHKGMLNCLRAVFPDALLVTGETPPRERVLLRQRFNDDPRCRLMMGNVVANGVGWSCTATSDVAFAELPWSRGELEQAIDRCHGLFRGEEGVGVVAHLLLAMGTIEEKVFRVLGEKGQHLGMIMDGEAGDDLPVETLERLEELLLRGEP